MNIAFSTLVVFLLLIPGLAFLRLYYSEEFSKEYFKASFFEIVISALLPSIVLHSVFCLLVCIIPGDSVSLTVIGKLIAGDNKDIQEGIKNIQDNIWGIVAYYLWITLFASFLGIYLRMHVRTRGYDRTIKLLRFQNYWHYILSGEILQFPNLPIHNLVTEKDKQADNSVNQNSIDLTYVDALVATSEGSIIYTGILVDYQLTKLGEGINLITLKGVSRRYLSVDKDNINEESGYREELKNYYRMPGDLFVIRYDQMINMNVTYYRFTDEII